MKVIPMLCVLFFGFALTAASFFSADEDGCLVTGTWTGTGFEDIACVNAGNPQCGTQCEFGYYGPIEFGVRVCKCHGEALANCLAIVELDENEEITSVQCIQEDDCDLGSPMECIDVEDAKNHTLNTSQTYQICQCLEPA